MIIYWFYCLFLGALTGIKIPQTVDRRKYWRILPKVWKPLFGGSSLKAAIG
jgi:hypothetical protein